MKKSILFWGVIEAVIWYGFIYYLLYAIKNPIELWLSSAILLALMTLGTMACPWVHNSDAWLRMMGKKN